MYFPVIYVLLLIGLTPNTIFAMGRCPDSFSEESEIHPYMSFEEAREFIRELDIPSIKEYLDCVKEGMGEGDLPQNPSTVYKKEGWVSWNDYLGIENNANGAINGSKPREIPKKTKLSKAEEREIEYIKRLDRDLDLPDIYEDIDLDL